MTATGFQTMIYALILSLAAGTPLVMAACCCTPLKRKVVQYLPVAIMPPLLVALTAPIDVVVDVGWFFMGGRMGLDETGRVFLLLAVFVWGLASFGSRNIFKTGDDKTHYHMFFLTAMAGNFGLILAKGMLGYYLFFAMMSFSAYGLIIQNRDKDAMSAGRIYLFMVMIGEVALFSALIILMHTGGSTALESFSGLLYTPLVLVLLFVGFGVKIGALPFHCWMISAYQTTPIPAAVALAGAMVNAGILGWLRFLPLGQISCPKGAVLFIILGALASVYGVIIGLSQKQAGAVLGGSSISQMGIVTVIFGMGLFDLETGLLALPVLILFVVHHSLAKSSLFFGYDLFDRQRRSPSYPELAAILFSALSLAGLPFTSGAIAKTGFKELTVSIGEPWSTLSTFFLPVTAIATTILMLHFITIIRLNRGNDKPGRKASRIIFSFSCIAVVATLWLWPAASNLAKHSVAGLKLLQGLLPVVVGFFMFFIWRNFSIATEFPVDNRKRKLDFNTMVSTVTRLLQEKENKNPKQDRLITSFTRLVPYLRRAEKVMGRWKVVGLSYIALCFCLLFLLL